MPHQATFRFYAELRDFLPKDARSGRLTRSFDVSGSVKDMIEASGVPHTEVDLIIANGRSVDFSYQVGDGDRISVYPVFESFDITPIVRVRPRPLRVIRFVADNHLRKLSRFLRLLGLDTLHQPGLSDHELVRISAEDKRILLTRDIGLLKHGSVTHGYYVRATDPREQVIEVVHRFHLARHLEPYTRCMACNGRLTPVDKREIADRLPDQTSRHVDVYQECSSCGKLYWQGAHQPALSRIVDAALEA